ncbi:hypothetical protein SJI00_17020 [Pseudomonas sp. RP23018S]|uniref:hypothetical protein n=1 Tax=Pseudomonas sp. RP23018S TaxID=3096037 RepID=UPI002ACA10C9|nr:hypothetical protein [Pseudomonas sp. RP23018S]MDZ5604475.1 hypothetical protein [Pseudomonas sp. RP23018S]
MQDISKTTPLQSDSAALIDTVVATFRSGMSEQNRQHAQNSFQFAALAAGGEYSRKDQREEWFDRVIEILGVTGWTVQQRTYEKETASTTTLTVGSVALRVFGAVGRAALGGPIGDALGALAQQAFDGLKTMTDDVEVFLARNKDSLKGLTGIVGCVEVDGSLHMVISALDTKAPDNQFDVLGINVHLESSEYYKGTAWLTFNKDTSADVRDHITRELGDHALKSVLSIKLPKRA